MGVDAVRTFALPDKTSDEEALDANSLEISPDYLLHGTSPWDHPDFLTTLRALLTPIVRPPYWLKLSRLIAD